MDDGNDGAWKRGDARLGSSESLNPSDETTKTSRILGLSIVETKRLTKSHERAHQK